MSVDRYFRISERGPTFAREIRGGFATWEIHWLLWAASALFLVYFAIDPIEQLLGAK